MMQRQAAVNSITLYVIDSVLDGPGHMFHTPFGELNKLEFAARARCRDGPGTLWIAGFCIAGTGLRQQRFEANRFDTST